ncbi:hypothetical protein [Dyadobacter sp. MSC1_007]|jgi:hypothetical protein|uniref:hypothetical protein n=1 Tax=Dyadobacter sp. MSC1_007 TaxID=2909264 RepID=UPI00202DD2F1|nr:hypothetical protein [Dyadobacter sp. MSC1_007]
MKNSLIYLVMILLVGLGCKEEAPGDDNGECVGSAFYYLDNQSSRDLTVKFPDRGLNRQIDTTTVIAAGKRMLMGQDASFGWIPFPNETFASFALYAVSDGVRSLVYKQDPVKAALWVKRKHNALDPDFGCFEVDYTLIVTDDMLK